MHMKLSKIITKRRTIMTARKKMFKKMLVDYELYLFLIPLLVYFVVFKYIPMYGVLMAFKDYKPSQGVWGSTFVGLKHFMRYFNSPMFWSLIRNTLSISIFGLLWGFPFPIVLALLINQVKTGPVKKFIQTLTYAPHFVTVVVFVGMMYIMLSPTTGIINNALAFFGLDRIFFMGSTDWFLPIYIISGIWKGIGWGSIIYLSALTSVSPELHEAAMIDGASKFQRMLNIDFPAIIPTTIIILILDAGKIMRVNFDKVFLMQNAMNVDVSEVISTYVYKVGLVQGQYSFSTAVGLFNSVVNITLMFIVNAIARRVGETSLW